MRLRKDLLVVVCETFNRMFGHNHDSLVSQALNCGLIKDLLNILGSRLDNVPNASACKAQVVTCLKAMSRSLVYGDQVGSLLQASSVWSQYESQKHDLFIGMITFVLHLKQLAHVSFVRGQASRRISDLTAWHCRIPHHVTVKIQN